MTGAGRVVMLVGFWVASRERSFAVLDHALGESLSAGVFLVDCSGDTYRHFRPRDHAIYRAHDMRRIP